MRGRSIRCFTACDTPGCCARKAGCSRGNGIRKIIRSTASAGNRICGSTDAQVSCVAVSAASFAHIDCCTLAA